MGKTVLLDHAVRSASEDFRLAKVEGVESEMELAYAGLHRMLLPLLGGLDGLPDPQRRALQSAFGHAATGAPDRFLIGLATLSLICDAARDRPLLCVIDDAQWLDRESLETMAIAARRLDADPVAMLFAGETSRASTHRSRDSTRSGCAVSSMTPPPNWSAACSRRRSTTPSSTGSSWRPVESPLAIIELSYELSAAELSWRGLPPEPLPLGRRLEEHFLRQIHDLPEATRPVPARRRGRTIGGPGRDRRSCHPPRPGRGGGRRGVRSAPLQSPNPTTLSPPTDPVGCLRRRHCLRTSSCARCSRLRNRRSEGQRPARMASGGRIRRLR